MGIMRASIPLIFCLFWLCLVVEAFFKQGLLADESEPLSVPDSNVQKVLQQTHELQLAQHQTWIALLHFKQETLLQRFVSQADDKHFFLHKDGGADAEAELIADVEAFFSSSLIPQKSGQPIHAQCLFPARWWWIKQQLNISVEYDVKCPRLDAFMARVAHEKLFLVFPSMYLNNPGSTFGHTFLRFDNHDDSILLSQTLNYAARADESDDIVSYVSKGLFGGYAGYFRARPYFEMVQEYSNIENRDIWEYQLDFSEEELTQLVRHVWEVKGINFDYYFFRENCAYRLLTLLDAVRPNMSLTSEGGFSAYAIPVDTVRAIDNAGLIVSRQFRASLATQINDGLSKQDNEFVDLVLQISADDTAADVNSIMTILSRLESVDEKIEVLKQSYTILQFYGKSESEKSQNILSISNTLQLNKQAPAKNTVVVNNVKQVSPEKGHQSARISLGGGQQNKQTYLDIAFKPAFHDLLDAPQGYVDGAGINVFDVRLKWFEGNNLRLESLSLFNVSSLTPLSPWQKPVSWMFDFSFDRTQLSDDNSARNFISKGGVGFSLKKENIMPFVLLMGEWNLSSSYNKGYSLLLGLQAGLKYSLQNHRLLLQYEVDNAVSGFDLDRKINHLQWQYNMQINHAFRLSYKRIEYDFYNDEDWSLNYHYYF